MGSLTPEKARKILRDGSVDGKPLTPAQRRLFGLIAGGGRPSRLDKVDPVAQRHYSGPMADTPITKHPGPGGSDTHATGTGQEIHGGSSRIGLKEPLSNGRPGVWVPDYNGDPVLAEIVSETPTFIRAKVPLLSGWSGKGRDRVRATHRDRTYRKDDLGMVPKKTLQPMDISDLTPARLAAEMGVAESDLYSWAHLSAGPGSYEHPDGYLGVSRAYDDWVTPRAGKKMDYPQTRFDIIAMIRRWADHYGGWGKVSTGSITKGDTMNRSPVDRKVIVRKHPGPDGSDTHATGSSQAVHGGDDSDGKEQTVNSLGIPVKIIGQKKVGDLKKGDIFRDADGRLMAYWGVSEDDDEGSWHEVMYLDKPLVQRWRDSRTNRSSRRLVQADGVYGEEFMEPFSSVDIVTDTAEWPDGRKVKVHPFQGRVGLGRTVTTTDGVTYHTTTFNRYVSYGADGKHIGGTGIYNLSDAINRPWEGSWLDLYTGKVIK